ncbi:hypothetical protein EDB85DRAFT_1888829 [Lactarius pseudohatsudake]|nr:hypothetical protein EDB85DRAFT_1888829 [Lactarius pseudohatsudake]
MSGRHRASIKFPQTSRHLTEDAEPVQVQEAQQPQGRRWGIAYINEHERVTSTSRVSIWYGGRCLRGTRDLGGRMAAVSYDSNGMEGTTGAWSSPVQSGEFRARFESVDRHYPKSVSGCGGSFDLCVSGVHTRRGDYDRGKRSKAVPSESHEECVVGVLGKNEEESGDQIKDFGMEHTGELIWDNSRPSCTAKLKLCGPPDTSVVAPPSNLHNLPQSCLFETFGFLREVTEFCNFAPPRVAPHGYGEMFGDSPNRRLGGRKGSKMVALAHGFNWAQNTRTRQILELAVIALQPPPTNRAAQWGSWLTPPSLVQVWPPHPGSRLGAKECPPVTTKVPQVLSSDSTGLPGTAGRLSRMSIPPRPLRKENKGLVYEPQDRVRRITTCASKPVHSGLVYNATLVHVLTYNGDRARSNSKADAPLRLMSKAVQPIFVLRRLAGGFRSNGFQPSPSVKANIPVMEIPDATWRALEKEETRSLPWHDASPRKKKPFSCAVKHLRSLVTKTTWKDKSALFGVTEEEIWNRGLVSKVVMHLSEQREEA